ncbi:MAG: hypothetical protein ACKVX9_00205 [Blastocatellia bacterium]
MRRHASGCESCAGQWAAEEALDARLLEFGAATRDAHASPRVRKELRGQFLARRGAPEASQKVVSIESRRRQVTPLWMLAAAAALAACFALAGWFWLRAGATPGAYNEPDIAEQSALPLPPPVPVPEGNEPGLQSTASADPLPASSRPRNNRSRATILEKELVSEFVPLTLAADERAIENGTLVRMRLSRERLIAMGLPLQIEGAQKTIDAEVMLGDNGVAYAIRIVR